MAQRRKSVQYAQYIATASDATNADFPTITVDFPESPAIVYNAYVEVGFQDAITATGGTITEHRVAVSVNGGAYQTITETDDIANSAENMAGVIGPFAFPGLGWTAGSNTVDIRVYVDQSTGSTLGVRNLSAVLTVIYQADDAFGTSQLKTVRIPLGSRDSTLPTTKTILQAGEGSAIPQLTGVGGMLCEANPVIQDYYFIIEGNEHNNGSTTDWTLSVAIGAEATFNFQTQEAALATDRFCRWIYKPAVIPDTTSAWAFYLWASQARANHVSVTLVVTYKYDRVGTTRVLNSLLIPIEISSPMGSNIAANASRFSRDISIQEPGTITLKQSAVKLHWNAAATPATINVKVGSQTSNTYTTNASVVAGMFCLQHRFDALANRGAGISLARGINSFAMECYTTNASNQVSNVSGYITLNYESDVSPAGIGAHNTTLLEPILDWDALLQDRRRFSSDATIPETNYWLTSAGFMLYLFVSGAANAVTFDVECLFNEGKGGGYYDIYADAYQSDNERANCLVWMRGRDVFKRFPQDINPDRMDIETPRDYRLFSATTAASGMIRAITYHSQTWTVAGNISGHDAGLTSDVDLIMADTGEVMQTQTLSAGTTAFSFTVYDNTEDYYVSVYQDATHLGRSATAKAV